MAPVSDLRRMSSVPNGQTPQQREANAEPESDQHKVVLRPLQLDSVDSGCLLYRRMSKTANSSCSPRMYSIRSIKKYAEGRQRHRGASIPSESSAEAKVKERTVSNRSLPLPGDETAYTRLRNFSVTSKGVVNRGDSFRSKSAGSVPAFLKAAQEKARQEEPARAREDRRPCKVLLVGAHDVGKTALKNQFMTSEYICAYGYSQDDEMEKIVTVNLNNEESEMEFEKETLQEENAYSIRLDIDAYVIVYSVTHRKSYLQAKRLLTEIEGITDAKAVILVGNKTDLARLRVVTTDEGKNLATEMGCKFIETSVAINHQVDELLVGALTQVRIKAKMADKLRRKRESQPTNRRPSAYSGSKATGVLKRILKRACLKSKSCDNLHVL